LAAVVIAAAWRCRAWRRELGASFMVPSFAAIWRHAVSID
jgi:hypothetical protein